MLSENRMQQYQTHFRNENSAVVTKSGAVQPSNVGFKLFLGIASKAITVYQLDHLDLLGQQPLRGLAVVLATISDRH